MQEQIRNIDLINRLFEYNPETGVITWKSRNDVPNWWNTRYAGKSPTAKDSLGYIRAKITANGFSGYVSLHRICFFMHNGYLPEVVDHINGNVQDNRACNLRAANFQTNAWNRSANKKTKTGLKGVSVITYKDGPKKGQVCGYVAKLGHKGIRLYLGFYKCANEAAKVVIDEEKRIRSGWQR